MKQLGQSPHVAAEHDDAAADDADDPRNAAGLEDLAVGVVVLVDVRIILVEFAVAVDELIRIVVFARAVLAIAVLSFLGLSANILLSHAVVVLSLAIALLLLSYAFPITFVKIAISFVRK